MIGQIYRLGEVKENYDAIIIGSGIGGLTTAAFLSHYGKRVLVLERHYVAGGFTHTFRRRGYEWDVGVHYVGDVHKPNSVLRRAFDFMTEGQLKWQKMPDPYDRICFGETIYDYVSGKDAFIEKMVSYFPNEREAIVSYIDLVKRVNGQSKNYFTEKILPKVLHGVTKHFYSSFFRRFAKLTTKEVIDSLTDDKKLRAVLAAQFGDYGATPAKGSFAIQALVAKHYLDGGSYPVGGSSRIAATILPKIEKGGGKVLVKAEVAEILVEKNKAVGVRMSRGEEFRAPVIISNAGVLNTFGRLINHQVQERFSVLPHLSEVKPSLAHVGIYIGLKKTAEELDLPSSNLWIYPDYDHDENFARYEKDPHAPFPVVYISFPSAKDPSFLDRHPGRATIEIVGVAPYEWFKPWEDKPQGKRGDAYEENKKSLTQRYLEVLYKYVPQVKDCLDFVEMSTPLSTKHFSAYQFGEIYGLDHTPSRFACDWLRPQTAIKNLYLTGQDVATVGVGGALMGGILTASALLKKNLIKELY